MDKADRLILSILLSFVWLCSVPITTLAASDCDKALKSIKMLRMP